MQNGKEPVLVLEKRHGRTGEVMAEAVYDYIADREIAFIVDVDSEATINEEKFVATMKSLNSLDNFGPSKRGAIEITAIQEVKP